MPADPPLPPPPSLSSLENMALFLDFDGTLVELAATPDRIRVPAGLGQLLARLTARLDGRLAMVSGRALGDLDRHMDFGGIIVSGSHGLELRQPGRITVSPASPAAMEAARGEIERFAERDTGLLVEHKPAGVALHYRQAPGQEADVSALLGDLAARTGLTVQRGKMVAELRPAVGNKGDLVRALMCEPAFASARPLFVGDDLTDEDGFAAAAGLSGAGILVGGPRPTAARYGLGGVASVAAWLEEGAGA